MQTQVVRIGSSERSMTNLTTRRLPIGAELASGGVDFRVWAPDVRQLRVVFVGPAEFEAHTLSRDSSGYFSGFVPAVCAGVQYAFQVEASADQWPDPASRFQ